MFKKLNEKDLAELWEDIRYHSKELTQSTVKKDLNQLCWSLDELETLRRNLQRHYAAIAIERGEKLT